MPEANNQEKKDDNQPGWQFHAENEASSNQPTEQTIRKSPEPVHWTASEFIDHDKSVNWFVALALATAVLATVVYLLTKDAISTIMIIVAALAFGVFAVRKPRVLDYKVDDSGIKIENKFYPYGNFKAFAVVDEGSVEAIWLMPLKRFMPVLTIYFPPEEGKKIVDVIGNFLPFQNHEPDPLDRLVQRIRF